MEKTETEIFDTTEYQRILGERIRRFRREKQMTQMALALQVGVTNGQISTIERGLSAPSIGTLRRISEALAIPMVHFFDRPGDRDVLVVRRGERKRLTTPSSPEVLEILAGSKSLSSLQVALGAGQSCRRPGHDSTSELFLIIQQGEIELESETQVVVMKSGDSARLDGRSARSYRCGAEGGAVVLEVRCDQGV